MAVWCSEDQHSLEYAIGNCPHQARLSREASILAIEHWCEDAYRPGKYFWYFCAKSETRFAQFSDRDTAVECRMVWG